MTTVRWLASYEDGGQVVFRIGRSGDELVAEWCDVARLTASRDGKRSKLEVLPGAGPREVRKIEQGSARLLLRHAAGELAFHGSAIEVDGAVRVLLGRSGQGKSTLAAWMCAHGATLFADDAVAIDRVPHEHRWVVAAVEGDHWLDGDARAAIGLPGSSNASGEGKEPLVSPAPGRGEAPLAAFIELVFADVARPRLARLKGMEALAALVPQAVRFVLDEPALHLSELDRLADLISFVDVFRLERPRDLAHLPGAASLVRYLARANEDV